MRDAIRLELSPREYLDAKEAERLRISAQLSAILRKSHDADWYRWVLNRRDGIHDHAALTKDDKPGACPARGCNHNRPK